MKKALFVLITLLLLGNYCTSQKYIQITFVTDRPDHLSSNLVILANKKDYKITKDDFFTMLRIFKIHRKKLQVMMDYTRRILQRINKDLENEAKDSWLLGYNVEIVNLSASEDFFLNTRTYNSFFTQFENKLKDIHVSQKLIIAVEDCKGEI